MIPSVSGVNFADYLAAIQNGNTQHASIVFPNQSVTLTEADINAGGIEYQILFEADQDIRVGATPCAMIHTFLLNYDGSLSGMNFSDEFTVSLGVEISDGATPPVYTNTEQCIGYFIGQKPQRVNQRIIELTGYDRMLLFEQDAQPFFAGEAEGKTAPQYFADLCAYVGVTPKSVPNHAINTSKTFAIHPTTGVGRTCRQILGYLAEYMGCFARIAMDGEVELVWFSDHTEDYTAVRNDQMAEPDIAEFTVPAVDKLQVKVTEEDIGVIVGTGTNCYMVVDNPFFYGLSDADIRPYAENLYNRLNGFGTYTPVMVQVDGTWLVEPCDIITMVDESGNEFDLPIMNVIIVWNGNANIVYETTGQETRTELTAMNRQQLREGFRYHTLVMDIDSLVSIIGDRSGSGTTIAQDIEHLELIAENTTHVYVSMTDPALTEPVVNGDLWIKQEFESWQDIYDNVATWNDLNTPDRTWGTIYTAESYFRLDNKWFEYADEAIGLQAIEELRNKYTIVSGINIKPEGIEIDGSKYIKMKSGSEIDIESGGKLNVESGGDMEIKSGGSLSIVSGGTFDVNTNNFIIDSSQRKLQADDWVFNQNGLSGRFVNSLYPQYVTNFSISKEQIHSQTSPSIAIMLSDNCGLLFNKMSDNNNDTLWLEPITEDGYGGKSRLGDYTSGRIWDYTYFNHLMVYEGGTINGNSYFEEVYYDNLHSRSSKEIKHDIKVMPSQSEKIDKLKPVTFIYDSDKLERTRYGLIYEDTVEIMPDICTKDESNKAINYVELIPMLLKEIQELRARIKALEEREEK